MNDDAIFLTYRIDCIAGKPPPTVRVCCAKALRRRTSEASQSHLSAASLRPVRHEAITVESSSRL
ncbi:hypothetical protein EZZ81_18830 [Pseudomonas viridiflava]|uniref:Uncharacterized protein n=2 Tax=Pseudomonas viridiflava TaxID=33069 RepID=A0AA46VY11_PSEVI|nr:hypothetical protein EZZ81_18830 [Pseudomonas viridiflava]